MIPCWGVTSRACKEIHGRASAPGSLPIPAFSTASARASRSDQTERSVLNSLASLTGRQDLHDAMLILPLCSNPPLPSRELALVRCVHQARIDLGP